MRFLRLLLMLTVALSTRPLLSQTREFTRADTLRGKLTPLRTCYDVTYYELDIQVDPGARAVAGSNKIQFRAVTDFKRMQIDLAPNMEIEKITAQGKEVAFQREFGAVYIDLPQTVKQGSTDAITVFYHGKPQVATRPPWDGGFIWTTDAKGNPWVAVTVQGDGAFLWWPNKEHQSDEPDSMLLKVAVPDTLMNISNGQFRGQVKLQNGWQRWDWFISYPINNYNVTLNIGKFAHFDDFYVGVDGDTLALDYWVMPQNLAAAQKQFKQVHPMLDCFEKRFGKYPFYRDGFKLIESPHNGMEHQSAVAYGNGFKNGYRFKSWSDLGLTFDFIIIHEAAHEWWGNSVTSKDIADMWIHESFGAYAEALYVECLYGYEAYVKYQNGRKQGLRFDRPITGAYNVNNAGSGDMYSKGALILGTLRSVIDNDRLWFDIIHGIQATFKYQTVTAEQIITYFSERSGRDLAPFFEQYFRHTKLPELEITVTQKGDAVSAAYKWNAQVAAFNMPVKVTTAKDKLEFIYPTNELQTTGLGEITPYDFRVAEELFLIDVNLQREYLVADAP